MKRFRFLAIMTLLLAWAGIASGQTPYFDSIKAAKETAGYVKGDYILLSHNGGNFGKSKSDETIAKMAEMYKDVDIVVLQEVSTGEAGAQTVARLAGALNQLGASWDYAYSDPTGGTATERFAYLWKDTRIYLTKTDKRISLWSSLKGYMVRVPASATFHLKDGELLQVINVHLAPTAKHPEKEIKAFAAEGYEYFDNIQQVVAGDFNLSHKKLDSIFEKKLNFVHQIEGKTSLTNEKHATVAKYLAREYDNIYTKGFIQVRQAGILDFVPAADDFHEARKISDHLPVFIIFSASKP